MLNIWQLKLPLGSVSESWYEAREYCKSKDMHLPRIQSYEDLRMMLDLKKWTYNIPPKAKKMTTTPIEWASIFCLSL